VPIPIENYAKVVCMYPTLLPASLNSNEPAISNLSQVALPIFLAGSPPGGQSYSTCQLFRRFLTMLSTIALALSLIPLLSYCSPFFGAPLHDRRDDNQAQAAIASDNATITTTNTVASSSTVFATTSKSTVASIYTLPPEAFPTRPAQAPTVSPQSISSQPAAAAVPKPLVMAYYPDWAVVDPEKIDFKRFDWIDFAFAVPDKNYDLTWDDPKAPNMLRRLVSVAHASNKKVKLSVGGWSGSK
jgi:hypothetical protein